jgi:voltage-gated potassium channel
MFTLVIIAIFFGVLYSLLDPVHFGFKSKLDPFYFSFTTMSSVGYGDIFPKTELAKSLVMLQQTFILVEVSRLVDFFNSK